jgi:hypothetical protein
MKNLIKFKNNIKHKNYNKEHSKIFKGKDKMPIYGYSKATQQYINNEYGIKVHKTDIKDIQHKLMLLPMEKSKIKDNNNYNEYKFTVDNDKTKIIGNTNETILTYIVGKMESDSSKIPMEWSCQHDRTKWNINKKKDNQRKFDRNCKENFE